MKPDKLTTIAGILLLLFLAASSLGCAQGGAEASTNSEGEATAQTASSEETDDTASGDKAEADQTDGKGEEGEDDDEDKEEAVPVDVAELALGDIESVLRFSSNLEAEDQVQVFSQSKRLVRELLVEEGDQVRKDQLLIRLQDDEQRSMLAKVKSQLDKAEREFRQQERLYEQELISEQVYTDASFELEQLQISVDDANRELSYTEVRAPIAGTVTQRLVKVGDQVQIGQHLFDIVDFNSIVARIFVPEKHLQQLRPGLEARISTAAIRNAEHVGTVDRVAPIIDPQSGTVKVTIAIGGQSGLRPGLYVDVDLVMATHNDTVLVPKRAIVYDNDQMFVYRLGDERRVERVFLEPLLADKEFVEPVRDLEAGDRIVVAGQAGLKDNALVALPGDEDEATAEAEPEEEAEEVEKRT